MTVKISTKHTQCRCNQRGSTKTGVKLPKIILKTFSRNPLEWKSLRERYEAAIDENNEQI